MQAGTFLTFEIGSIVESMIREPKVAQRAPNVITGTHSLTVMRNAIDIIAGLVVTGLPLINGKPPKKTLMTVEMGEQRIKTTDFVAASQSPDWKTNILVYAIILICSTEKS